MIAQPGEQHNDYKGRPLRPAIHIRLASAEGQTTELDLLADTGDPYPIVIAEPQLQKFGWGEGVNVLTNFGTLQGGWLQVQIPELRFDAMLFGYASNAVAAAVQRSSSDLVGLAGLPL